MAGVPPGDDTAAFAKSGFSRAFTDNSSNKVHLAADGDTQRLAARLTQLGGVSGRVLDRGQAVSVQVDNDRVASVALKLTPWPE